MSIHFTRTQATPPSRHSNPFSTCWTKPGALRYLFSAGDNAESLVARLASAHWRGAIVGPHGAGKSTLLATLRPCLQAAGRSLQAVSLRDGQRRLPPDFLRRTLTLPRPLVVVDGYEQLSYQARWCLRRRCYRAGAGLLVTSHAATSLPTLAACEPNLDLVLQLTARLTRRVPSPVTPSDVAASHACHGGNVREILFDLYDRHERVCRAARTAAPAVA
jgi:hypothetical protein